MSAMPGSPKTCRDLHLLKRGAARLWSSRGRSGRSDRLRLLARYGHSVRLIPLQWD
jgi:hypothetical protein